MPTGYTAMIEDGCSFEEFVWGCARAFGALVMMRDDPADTPVPEKFEPSDHYAKKIEQARAELVRLDDMTAEEINAAVKVEREATIAENTRYALKHQEKCRRYEAILDRVRKWQPPSPDHQGLKDFMIEQIRISIDDHPYQRELPECDPSRWLAGKKKEAQRNLAYSTQHHAEEIQRTEGRNRWVRQLRESVPPPIAAGLSAEGPDQGTA